MGSTPKDNDWDESTRADIAKAYFEYARALWQDKQEVDGALQSLNQVILLNPKHADAYAFRAFLRIHAKDYKKALADAAEAVRLDPNSAQAFHVRGVARIESDDEEGAFDDFSKAIKLSPGDPNNYLNRANIYHKWGNAKQAESDMAQYSALEVERYTKVMEKDPDNPAPFVQRGVTKQTCHMAPQSAIDDFTEAIKRAPRMSMAYALRASARHALEDYDGAYADASKAIEIDPEYAHAYAVRGAASCNLHHLDEAIRDCTTAIEKDSQDAFAFHIRALAKSDARDYDGAIKDWQEALRLKPEEKGVYETLIREAVKSRQER